MTLCSTPGVGSIRSAIILLVKNSIKLLILNVSIFDENNEKLIRFLKEINPNIICLQEVTRKVDASALDSFITKTAVDQATPRLPYSFYAPNWALRDFKQKNFHGKKVFHQDFGGFIEYGNYIKSRFKIIQGKSVFIQHHFSYLTDWEWMENHPGEEPRMVQIADLELNSRQKLRLINYHGIWSKDKQGNERTKSACRKLIQLTAEVTFPAIICGDFNLFPDTESIKILKEKFSSLVDKYNVSHTRPKTNELSSAKRNVVDYIFASKKIAINSFKVINSDVSDHFPLLVEFGIK